MRHFREIRRDVRIKESLIPNFEDTENKRESLIPRFDKNGNNMSVNTENKRESLIPRFDEISNEEKAVIFEF